MATRRPVDAQMNRTVLAVLLVVLACAVVVIITLAARPSGGLTVPKGSAVVHVDEHDFGIDVKQTQLHAGNYVFVDSNHGPSQHELVMWKTKDAADALPRDGNDVNEDSSALESVLDSGSSLAPGETRLLTANLVPGHYVIVCNLPGHYHAGMHVDITVT